MPENKQPNSNDTQPLISAHIFVFPFKWRIATDTSARSFVPFREKVKMDRIKQIIQDTGQWEKFTFEPKPEAPYFNSYNEYAYFHDYTREVLGVNYKPLQEEETGAMVQYEYKLVEKDHPKFTISIKNAGTFNLDLKAVTLNIYEIGVGVMAFHLENYETTDFDNILKINDYGRRIFPQFLGGKSDESEGNLLLGPQGAFLPLKIELAGIRVAREKPISVTEDFSNYSSPEEVKGAPFELPAHISKLLGAAFKTRFNHLNNGDILIHPVLDDRMFVMSMVFNDTIASNLAKYNEETGSYAWETNDDWYRFVFVDGDKKPTIDSRNMKRDLLKASTYDRWVETQDDKGTASGHVFGIARYSFVILSARNWFTENILRQHFSNIYFQMALLTLVQRASVLSFSAEAAYISKHLPRAQGLKARTIDNIADLYLQYMKFIQKIYFREVTTQEQGIELYNLLQDRLNIKSNVEDLDREMNELNQFVEAQQQRNINLITYWFFPAVLIISFFGLNYFSPEGIFFDTKGHHYEVAVLLIIPIVIIFTLVARPLLNLLRK